MIPLPARAYVFIGLNVARFLSILTLILVFSASIQVMVSDIKAIRLGPPPPPTGDRIININGTEYYYECDYLEHSTVPLQPGGSMFAIINHLFIIFQCVLLILSEIGWPAAFFDNFLPVFGREHGVGILGFLQIFIGAAVLSHHVGTFALVSAFFLFTIGVLNVLLGLVFRSTIRSKRSILAWRERAKAPALPRTAADFSSAVKTGAGIIGVPAPVANSVFSHFTGGTAQTTHETVETSNGSHAGFGFGRQNEKSGGLKALLMSVPKPPQDSLPRYAPKRVPELSRASTINSTYSHDSDKGKTPMEVPSRI